MPDAINYAPIVCNDLTFVIPTGGPTTSPLVDFYGTSLTAIEFVTMTSASLALWGSIDGVTAYPLYNASGVAMTVACADGTIGVISPMDLMGIRWLAVKPVGAEAAERTLRLLCRGM